MLRLAVCGNVFPFLEAKDVLAAIQGPLTSWAKQVSPDATPVGLGLALSASSADTFFTDPEARETLKDALKCAGLQVWTGNAFVFGDFHGGPVKEQAFLPDWTSPDRLEATLKAAEVLAQLQDSPGRVSLSTCPLGYGPQAKDDAMTPRLLERLSHGLAWLESRTGVKVVIGFEPEPDGTFETQASFAQWLTKKGLNSPHLGLCWDLCHGEVVGENSEELLHVVQKAEVPIAKVQISSALQWKGEPALADQVWLQKLAQDRWFHQVRGRMADGTTQRWPDLAPALQAWEEWGFPEKTWVHCHVPVHQEGFGASLEATPWQAAAQRAEEAGVGDFEVETYTLSTLPGSEGGEKFVLETMAKEYLAARSFFNA